MECFAGALQVHTLCCSYLMQEATSSTYTCTSEHSTHIRFHGHIADIADDRSEQQPKFWVRQQDQEYLQSSVAFIDTLPASNKHCSSTQMSDCTRVASTPVSLVWALLSSSYNFALITLG